ncbi:unnamed protein product, partial [Prorocentrum cordatum]
YPSAARCRGVKSGACDGLSERKDSVWRRRRRRRRTRRRGPHSRKRDDQGGAGKSTPMPAFEKRRRDPAGIYKGPRNHLRGVWDRQPAPLSVGMQMALMTRELLSGLGAHRIPGKLHIAAECYCLDWTRTEFRGSCTHRRMSKRSRVQDLLEEAGGGRGR